MAFINLNSIVIDDSTVVLDPWDHGVDGNETQTQHTQVFTYMRNPKNNDTDSNYTVPLDFMVIVDVCAMKAKRIIRLPLGSDQTATPVSSQVPHRRTDPIKSACKRFLPEQP